MAPCLRPLTLTTRGALRVLDVADAEALISSRVQALGTRSIALADACGTVLRETIFAERDQPPFDRVTMDGIAIAYRDWRAGVREFEVLATQAAGAPPSTLTGVKQCVEIMTGAMLPAGADTVIPVERITRRNDRVLVDADYKATDRQFVHPRGSDRRGGSVLLKPGIVLGPPEIAIIAGAGRAELLIAKAVRVAVISTGDELVEPGQPVLPHQIRSSNDRAITAALERHCKAAVTRASLKDEREQMLARIRKLHDEHDALILSGGVSMGKFDFVPSVLEQLGVELVFHKIEQRPGRPMWFGISRDGKPVFALPGNPVSTLVCLYRYVLPALRKALGENAADKEYVRLADCVQFTPDLTYFLPVTLDWTGDGITRAQPNPTNTSGDFVSLAGTAGFIELPRGTDTYPENLSVRLFRW